MKATSVDPFRGTRSAWAPLLVILLLANLGWARERSENRAFYTAPPVIPHSARSSELRSDKCLHCHLQARKLGKRRSVRTPHPELSNCQQCHVARTGPYPENSFQGLEAPGPGTRLFAGAPPTIPHRLAMRENCVGCHNPTNPDEALRVLHAHRFNCLQCHLPREESQF